MKQYLLILFTIFFGILFWGPGTYIIAQQSVQILNTVTVRNAGTFAVQAASTLADGANVTLGAKADAKSTATDTTPISVMSVLKQISASVQAPVSQAVTNIGTFAVQVDGAALTALQLIDDVVATIGSAVPTKGNATAGTDGTNARLLKTDTSGELQVDVLTLPTLPAGTNAIGKLSANSGVDIGDVDVTSLPALAAGTNYIGEVAHSATATTTNSALGCYLVSAASTNATNCKSSAGNLYGFRFVNTTSTTYYLRMYNSSGSPTCSSATGFIESIPIPNATGTGAGIVAFSGPPVGYSTGVAFCFTGGGSSTDNTNAATGVYGAIYYK